MKKSVVVKKYKGTRMFVPAMKYDCDRYIVMVLPSAGTFPLVRIFKQIHQGGKQFEITSSHGLYSASKCQLSAMVGEMIVNDSMQRNLKGHVK